ncbi:MAG: hypothetical protein BGO50_01625 [Rhodanobacter sp. 67-28]|nr:MAG: hypothetical protein ABS98_07130 [Xanthomonadaceae bacterium SCN 69-48]OJW42460.1 MAG: hypothetical protein BGO50_01625 [Rhodanobacter sp. 67-28]
MPTNLFANTGQTFEIYSIGDGLYMKHVLDGVAMLSNAGVLLQLGCLGLVLGLLLIGFKAVASGLERMEFSWLFLSFIVFVIMFGMRCNVVIYDMGGAPGTVLNGAYKVNNVPFGMAFAGHVISSLGLDLTEDMEQAYGLPSVSSADGTGGFGRTLEWINEVRSWNVPALAAGTSGTLPAVLANETSYLNNCTYVAAATNKLSLPLANNAASPWTTFGSMSTGGLGWNNNFVTFPFINANGSETDYPCGSGFAVVGAQVLSSDTFGEFVQAIVPRAKPFVLTPGITPTQQMQDSFASIGLATADAQTYVALSSTLVAENAAASLSHQATGADILSALMMNQAEAQRDTEWAANETMFRSVARPMTAFFESMIYACAPFMALLVGFGSWGIQMVGKYLVLTIWVMLWLPVMSICNLFEITMAQHGVAAMQTAAANGGATLSMTSLAATAHLQSQVANWLAVGSLLAASTPALTLMLVFGGAMAATSLAGRLQGSDHVNEKQVTPDSMSPGAVMDVQSRYGSNAMEGTSLTGGKQTEPVFTGQGIRQSQMQSASSAMSSASSAYAAEASAGISDSFTNSRGETVTGSRAFSHSGTQAQQFLASWGQKHGFQVSQGNEAAFAAMVSAAASGNLALASKIGASVGIRGSDNSTFSLQDAKALQESVSRSAGTDQNFSVAESHAIQDTLTQQASNGSTAAQSVQSGDSYKKTLSDLKTAQDQYSKADSATASLGMSSSMGINNAAEGIVRAGAANSVIGSAIQYGGADAMKVASSQVEQAPWKNVGDATARKVQAALLVLGGQVPASAGLRSEYEGDRAKALVSALSSAGFGTAGSAETGASADPSRNSGAAAGVAPGAAAGQATQHLAEAPAVPSMGGVMSRNAGNMAGLNRGSQSSDTIGRSGAENPASTNTNNIGEGYASGALHSRPGKIDETVGAQVAASMGSEQGGAVGHDAASHRIKEGSNARASEPVAGFGKVGQMVGASAQGLWHWANNEGPSNVFNALRLANHADSMSDSEFKSQYTGGAHFSDWGGIQPESVYKNSKDPETRAATNAEYASNLAGLQQSYEGRNPNTNLLKAMAIVHTTQTQGGATPEMARDYGEVMRTLSPNERDVVYNTMLTSVGSQHGENTSATLPLPAREETATGSDGLSPLK